MKSKRIIKFIIYIVALICFTIFFSNVRKEENKVNPKAFNIHFFNAGKADAILINNNDKTIMIDTGEITLSNEIKTYFRENDITKIDYLIITHFDKDHVGSASTIINNYEIGSVLQSNYPKDSVVYRAYLEALRNKNIEPITISDNYNFAFEELSCTVNGPKSIYDEDESNNSSLIVSINYNNANFLFMGDAKNPRIKDFINTNNMDYDFIKIPYHGHYLKQLDNLLDNTKPEYAVITSSASNLEDDKTIDLLKKNSIEYYLTRKGPINISFKDNSIVVDQ